ncbi:MAG: hypothetical protein AAFY31_10505 [Pseudomonadota bacterium]
MTHPIHAILSRLDRYGAQRRTRHAMAKAQADPHLARDVGLPFKPAVSRKPELW